MARAGTMILGAAVLVAALLAADAALAQDPGAAVPADNWPAYRDVNGAPLAPPASFQRGPGGYLNTIKILSCWVLFALWVKTADWIGQDVIRLKLNYLVWNSLIYSTFVGSFIATWLMPWFAVGISLMTLSYIVPLIVYLIVRNQAVPAHEKILTREHIRHGIAAAAGMVGVKIAREKQADYQKGAAVDFKGTAGQGRDGEGNLILARQSPGYVPAKGLVAELLDRRGDAVMLEATQQNVSMRYQIDGVWHSVDPLPREQGDLVLGVVKTLAGMDPAQRVKRQEGMIGAGYQNINYYCKVQSQGVEAGERLLMQLRPSKAAVRPMEELGMRPKMQEQLLGLLSRQEGFVLFAAPPAGGGLSSLFDAGLKMSDRYMRDFVAIDEVGHRELEVENVHGHTYNPAQGETALATLKKVVRTYPNVIVVRNLADADTVAFLCEQVQEERVVMGAIRAKDASEALLRVLMMKVPPRDFVNAISGVVCVRLIRKLCDACKEAYAPQPELLQQMGLPPGKIQALFRPPTQPDPKKPCPVCQAIGYTGRTGIFELLVVDDGVREVLMKSPKPDLVRGAARKAGMKTFQEEGLLLVVKGVTSLTELQRVLKS